MYPTVKRYRKKTLVHIGFDLNRNTDPDLVEWMQHIDNRAAYFKKLIRKDMEETQGEKS